MSVLLFVYGSAMASAEMRSVSPDHRALGAARLPDRRLEFRRRSVRWGAGAADVVPAPGEEVWGVLYELPEAALAALDAREGEGTAYRRIEVELERAGQPVRAHAYEVIEREPEPVPPAPAYVALMVAGAREHELPEPWVSALSGLLASAAP